MRYKEGERTEKRGYNANSFSEGTVGALNGKRTTSVEKCAGSQIESSYPGTHYFSSLSYKSLFAAKSL